VFTLQIYFKNNIVFVHFLQARTKNGYCIHALICRYNFLCTDILKKKLSFINIHRHVYFLQLIFFSQILSVILKCSLKKKCNTYVDNFNGFIFICTHILLCILLCDRTIHHKMKCLFVFSLNCAMNRGCAYQICMKIWFCKKYFVNLV